MKDSSLHIDIGQEFIYTTADKLKLNLIDYKDTLLKKNQWLTPLGILLTTLASLVATTFNTTFGLSADIWKAFFIFAFVLSSYFLFRSLYHNWKNRGKYDIDSLVNKMKRSNDI